MPKTNVSVKLTGLDGNVFAIIGVVSAALVEADRPATAREFRARAFQASSYDEVLRLAVQYVDVG